jgi:signal transduction histidine kinase
MVSKLRNVWRSFFWQLASAYFAITLLSLFSFTFFFIRFWEQYSDRSRQVLHWELAEELGMRLRPHLGPTLNVEQIHQELYQLSLLMPELDAYLLSDSGEILAASPSFETQITGSVDLAPVREFLAATAIPGEPILGPLPGVQGEQVPFSAARVEIGPAPGYLYAVLSGNRKRVANKMVGDLSAGTGAALFLVLTLLFSLLLGLLVFNRLTRRFREMTQVLAEYRQGNFTPRLNSIGQDELGDHAAVINSMADTIVESIETIRRKDVQRAQLIANVSHDLRTPIAVFRTTIDTLLHDVETLNVDRVIKKLELLRGSGTALNTLIEELFMLARLRAEEYSLHLQTFPLEDLLLGVVEQASALAEAAQLQLDLEVDDPELVIRADPELLARALLNLISNAIKFTPAGEIVTVLAKTRGEVVEVSIRDTGCGIPAAALPHLFDRSYQVDGTPKALGGAGIGLAIVKRIIELHDGMISVESVEGKGTTFSFCLPIAERS